MILAYPAVCGIQREADLFDLFILILVLLPLSVFLKHNLITNILNNKIYQKYIKWKIFW